MKRVYHINSTADIERKVEGLNARYNIVIVFLSPPTNNWIKIVGNTTPKIDNNIFIIDLNLIILHRNQE